jgi:hypothetical protein
MGSLLLYYFCNIFYLLQKKERYVTFDVVDYQALQRYLFKKFFHINIFKSMTLHNFYRTKLVYQVLDYIAQKKKIIFDESMKNSNNFQLFDQILDTLNLIIEYETNFLKKITKFTSSEKNDYNIFDRIKYEIDVIVKKND